MSFDANAIAASKQHLDKMREECDLDINLPNEANRQRAFLTTLRESYGGLQAQENLLLTMESMQELEPVNPDDLQLLDSEAALLRNQSKQLRVEVKETKDAVQAAVTSLADQWEKFEELMKEHAVLVQQEAADKLVEAEKDSSFFLAALERQRAHGSFGSLAPSEAHMLLPQTDLDSCATLRDKQAAVVASTSAQLATTREKLQRAQNELNSLQLAASQSRTEIARLRAAITAAPPVVLAAVPSSTTSETAPDAEVARMQACRTVVSTLSGVSIVSDSATDLVLSVELSPANHYTLQFQRAVAAFSAASIASMSSGADVKAVNQLCADVFTHFVQRSAKPQALAFVVRETRARLAALEQRRVELQSLTSSGYNVTVSPTDARLVSITFKAGAVKALAKATLLVSPDYPTEGAFVHLIAQLAGAPPLTVDALLKVQERLNAQQSTLSLTAFVQLIQSELDALLTA